MGDHPSRPFVTKRLQQPTRMLGGKRQCILLGLAPSGVYHASPVTSPAVSSYLTFSPLPCRRYIFCGTFLRVAPSGYYPPLFPMESGRSSDSKTIRGRLADSSSYQHTLALFSEANYLFKFLLSFLDVHWLFLLGLFYAQHNFLARDSPLVHLLQIHNLYSIFTLPPSSLLSLPAS